MFKLTQHKCNRLMFMLLTVTCSMFSSAYSADSGFIHVDIKSQNAAVSLMQLAQAANVEIMMPQNVGDGVQLSAIQGEYTLVEALDTLLKNSGLIYEFTAEDSVVIQKDESRGGAYKSEQYNKKVQIEEVIVTAEKREQSAFDVPISIMALGSEELEERKISDWKDLSIAVPGLVVQENAVQRRIFMRGIGNFAGDSSLVGIYVDEASVTANSTLQPDLRIHDLERVEVLRGPQGTTWGNGAVGGTIRFITKDPQLDAFGFDANMSASLTENGSPGQKLQGVVNIPLVADELGVRIAATYENTGGWVDQPAAGQEDINDENLTNFRIKGLWKPTDAFTVNTMAIIHRNELGAQAGGEDENGNFTQAFSQLTTPSGTQDYEIYGLTLAYDFDSVRLTSSSNFIDAIQESRWFPYEYPASPPPAPPLAVLFIDYTADTEIFNQEIRLMSTGDGPWQWTIGTFYEETDGTVSGHVYIGAKGDPLPASPFPTGGTLTTTESWAVFGNTSFALTDRFEAGAGLRYFEDHRVTISGFVFNPIGATSNDGTFTTVNPRLFINYDLTDSAKIYASAAKGFRSGGLVGGNVFEPENVWSYEVGAKAHLFDSRVTAEVSLYYSDYTDIIMRGCPPPPKTTCFDFNAGNADIYGIDWTLAWQVNDKLALGTAGTALDHELVEIRGTQTPYIAGDPLDWVADYQYTFWGEYDFLWLGKPGHTRLEFSKKGPSRYRNRTLGDGTHFYSESDIIDMLNLYIDWQWSDGLSFGIFAQNLLNDRGFLDPTSIQAFTPRARPRTVGIEFGVSF